MTESDRDQAAPGPSTRPRVRVRTPILDLESSRVKDETPPMTGPPAAETSTAETGSAAPSSMPPGGPEADASPGQEPARRPSSLPPGQAVAPDELAPLPPAAAGGSGADAGGAEAPPPRATSPAEPPRPPRRGVGIGRLLAASLLGGALGAGLGLAGERLWRERFGDPLQQRLTQLEQRTVAGPPGDALAGIERRLAAAEGTLKEASDRARAAEAAAAAATARAGEALERPVQAASAPPASGPDPRIEALADRVQTIEGQLAERTKAAEDAAGAAERRAAERDERVAGLERKLQESASADAARDDALQKRLLDGERRFEEQDRRLTAQSQEAQQRLAATAQAVEARLAELTKAANTQRQEPVARASARLALAERLARALRDGEPYAAALAALRRAGGDEKALAALDPFADQGAPRVADLAREFRAFADRLRSERRRVAAAEAPATWEDRLRSMADALVTVRPVPGDGRAGGSGAAPDPLDAVASALDRGDVAAAARAWAALPEATRQSGAAFGARLQQRAEAEEASVSLGREALAAFQAATAQ